MHIDYLQHTPSIMAKINMVIIVRYNDMLSHNFMRENEVKRSAKSPITKTMLKQANQCLIPTQERNSSLD